MSKSSFDDSRVLRDPPALPPPSLLWLLRARTASVFSFFSSLFILWLCRGKKRFTSLCLDVGMRTQWGSLSRILSAKRVQERGSPQRRREGRQYHTQQKSRTKQTPTEHEYFSLFFCVNSARVNEMEGRRRVTRGFLPPPPPIIFFFLPSHSPFFFPPFPCVVPRVLSKVLSAHFLLTLTLIPPTFPPHTSLPPLTPPHPTFLLVPNISCFALNFDPRQRRWTASGPKQAVCKTRSSRCLPPPFFSLTHTQSGYSPSLLLLLRDPPPPAQRLFFF